MEWAQDGAGLPQLSGRWKCMKKLLVAGACFYQSTVARHISFPCPAGSPSRSGPLGTQCQQRVLWARPCLRCCRLPRYICRRARC
jgi:hypothetical protein